MLHIKKQNHVIDSALENDAMPPAPVKSIPHCLTKTTTRKLYEKQNSASLLERVQAATNSNFDIIRRTVEKAMDNCYSLSPHLIYSISEFERLGKNRDSGYVFRYHKRGSFFSSDYAVETNSQGNIKRVYTTK